MAIIHHKDKRSGITYVYESYSYWDKEKQQSRAKRKLIGRLDETTGEIIPTDGRCKKRSPYYSAENNTDNQSRPRTLKEYKSEYERLMTENAELRKEIQRLNDIINQS